MDDHVLVRLKVEKKVVSRSCSSCVHKSLCLPGSLSHSMLDKIDKLIQVRKHLRAGDALYYVGSPFHGLYAVKSGLMKIESYHEDGKVQVNGFYMKGEIYGFDGIDTHRHLCSSIAIEDSELCLIPFDTIEHKGEDYEPLKHHIYALMSREIGHYHSHMMLLGSAHGEERLASFLLDFSYRMRERGSSANNLILRMTREDIGNYLGMKVETVSRIFTRFQEMGLLEVHNKYIDILDNLKLKELIDHPH